MLLRWLRVLWLSITVISLTVGVVVGWPSPDLLTILPVPVAFAGVALLLTVRVPGNTVGWYFGGEAAVVSLLYGAQGLATAGVGASVANWSAWLGTWPIPLTFVFLILSIACFPDGRLPSPRWRIPVALAVAVPALSAVVAAFGDSLFTRNFPHLHDPVQLIPRSAAVTINNTTEGLQLLGFLLVCTGAIWVRFRRSRGVQREQMKWFLFVVAVNVVAFAALANAPFGIEPVVAYQVFAPLIPVAVAVAILRYRLYDIDRLVSRTVSWVLVSGLLAGVYLLIVIVSTRELGVSSPYAVAASTLAAAALLHPVRRRVQDTVDRRFNRARFDAARTVESFAARVRDDVELDAVCAELLGVVRSTIAPASAGLWLSTPRDAARGVISR